MSVIDDLKFIHERDSKDALGIAEKQWQQYQHNFNFSYKPTRLVESLVIAGMGGSGLAAKALNSWPTTSVPLQIIQDYDLPPSVNKNTLLICSSYSGNTEEIISVLGQALKISSAARPQIIVIASGGSLLDLARTNKLLNLELPPGYQPRMTFGYQLKALTEILVAFKLTSASIDELKTASDWLKLKITDWIPTVPEKNNLAKRLALDVVGKSIVVYAGPKLAPAAYKWKISFNENAKNIAWFNQYSEFNHNEFMGWTAQPVDKLYSVIELRSLLENKRIQERFKISERLLSGKRPAPEVVEIQGDNLPKQLLWSIALGDFVSLYVALLNNIDPTPVELIEKLKQELK